MARRLRQVTDLYITGQVAVLVDGTPLWVQALNPFEQDTARNEAQIAKARITLALKEFGSDERAKVRMFFFEDGLDDARRKVVDAQVAESMPRVLERIQNDPEWTERLEILARGLDDLATPAEPEEEELLEKLTGDYTEEVGRRLMEEREFNEDRFASSDEETLWEAYLDWYLTRRSSELMMAEFRLHQLLYGVRWCNGTLDDGQWDHSGCEGHAARVFSSKDDVRSAPEDLIVLLTQTVDDLELTVREAKNSRRQGSFSDSSPLPSEAGESTASTRIATPVVPPGSSPLLSPTH